MYCLYSVGSLAGGWRRPDKVHNIKFSINIIIFILFVISNKRKEAQLELGSKQKTNKNKRLLPPVPFSLFHSSLSHTCLLSLSTLFLSSFPSNFKCFIRLLEQLKHITSLIVSNYGTARQLHNSATQVPSFLVLPLCWDRLFQSKFFFFLHILILVCSFLLIFSIIVIIPVFFFFFFLKIQI